MNDEKITLELTRDEARALMDGWAFALGPMERNAAIRQIITKMWAMRVKASTKVVEDVTKKLTTILDKFLREHGVDIDKLDAELDKMDDEGLDWGGLGL